MLDVVMCVIINFDDEVFIVELSFVFYVLFVILVGGVLVFVEIKLENEFKV